MLTPLKKKSFALFLCYALITKASAARYDVHLPSFKAVNLPSIRLPNVDWSKNKTLHHHYHFVPAKIINDVSNKENKFGFWKRTPRLSLSRNDDDDEEEDTDDEDDDSDDGDSENGNMNMHNARRNARAGLGGPYYRPPPYQHTPTRFPPFPMSRQYHTQSQSQPPQPFQPNIQETFPPVNYNTRLQYDMGTSGKVTEEQKAFIESKIKEAHQKSSSNYGVKVKEYFISSLVCIVSFSIIYQ